MQVEKTGARGEVRSMRPPSGTKVLVVDDDSAIREVLEDVLRAQGYEVVSAADGVDALERLDTGKVPDVIVTDLMMPKMDGWTLIKELHARASLADVPVIVMTAGGQAMLATAPAADAYVSKPFDVDHLLAAVERSYVLRAARQQ
jgi:CheY-like chemotaxis protein